MPGIVRAIVSAATLVSALVVTPMAVQAQSHILPEFKECLADVKASGGGEDARNQCYWQHWSLQADGR